MRKTLRIVALTAALFIGAASIMSCTVKPKESSAEIPSEEQTEERSEPVEDGSEEPSEEETEPTRPEAEGGELQLAYDLSFCVPDFMEPMAYNGMLGVYEFYTGTFNGSPTGLDFALEVYSDSELKGETLETYATTASRAAKAGLTAFERVEYNGYEWLRLTNNTNATYYYAVFNEGLYCIMTLQGADTAENYLTARNMLEETLYFAAE